MRREGLDQVRAMPLWGCERQFFEPAVEESPGDIDIHFVGSLNPALHHDRLPRLGRLASLGRKRRVADAMASGAVVLKRAGNRELSGPLRAGENISPTRPRTSNRCSTTTLRMKSSGAPWRRRRRANRRGAFPLTISGPTRSHTSNGSGMA